MNDGVGGVATPTTTVGEGCGTVTAYIQTYRDFLKSKVEFWDTECFFNWILKYWTKNPIGQKNPIGTEKGYMETRTAQFSFMQQIAHKLFVDQFSKIIPFLNFTDWYKSTHGFRNFQSCPVFSQSGKRNWLWKFCQIEYLTHVDWKFIFPIKIRLLGDFSIFRFPKCSKSLGVLLLIWSDLNAIIQKNTCP